METAMSSLFFPRATELPGIGQKELLSLGITIHPRKVSRAHHFSFTRRTTLPTPPSSLPALRFPLLILFDEHDVAHCARNESERRRREIACDAEYADFLLWRYEVHPSKPPIHKREANPLFLCQSHDISLRSPQILFLLHPPFSPLKQHTSPRDDDREWARARLATKAAASVDGGRTSYSGKQTFSRASQQTRLATWHRTERREGSSGNSRGGRERGTPGKVGRMGRESGCDVLLGVGLGRRAWSSHFSPSLHHAHHKRYLSHTL